MTKHQFDSSTSIATAVGNLNLYAFENKIVSVEYNPEPVTETGKSSMLKTAKKQLEKYFAGSSTKFDFAYEISGTPFQEAVWQTISQIEFGESVTYGEIAQAIGNPAAVRAVGAAVGANPLPLLIGCHRVLGSNRKITGYTGGEGIATKQWLLNHEKIAFRN